ncbi:alpha/beta fold hydrolase [Oceanithermus sp.]
MPYIHIYGVNIVYDRWGEGPLRVLVARRADDWRGCGWPGGYEYLAPDLPGHGRSQGEPGLQDDELAEYLLGMLVMLHATEAEIYAHPNAAGVAAYLSERVGMPVQVLAGCSPPA